MAAFGDAAKEAPRREEARGQIRVQGVAPALEGELPDRHVVARPDAGDRRADGQRAGLAEQALDLGFVRQVGAGHRRTTQLSRQRFRTVAAAVVVDDDLCAFCREGARARRANSPRGAGYEHALSCQTGLHP